MRLAFLCYNTVVLLTLSNDAETGPVSPEQHPSYGAARLSGCLCASLAASELFIAFQTFGTYYESEDCVHTSVQLDVSYTWSTLCVWQIDFKMSCLIAAYPNFTKPKGPPSLCVWIFVVYSISEDSRSTQGPHPSIFKWKYFIACVFYFEWWTSMTLVFCLIRNSA